jgi:ABC-2 type transport system ATP-binding protein
MRAPENSSPDARRAPLLEFRRVSKRFGSQVAVDDVSLALVPGEIFGLLGPNGAGKTTLLRMGVDLLRPDSGQVVVLGEAPRPEVLERIGYLPEERGLPTRARVLNLLTYLGELKGMTRSGSRDQARRLLRRMELDVRESSKIGELSKGNQQKVQLASALMGDPKVLLVDEPFSGLDPVNRSLAIELLKESVGEGKAVVISTHQLQHVEQLCQRLLLLNHGRVLLEGEVDAVRRSHADGSILVSGTGDFGSLQGVERWTPVLQGNGQRPIRLFLRSGVTPDAILQQVVERRLSLSSFSPCVPTLEEIFVRAVEKSNG